MEDKQKPIDTAKTTPPMALAELEIMKLERAKSAANKNPEIRNIALLFIVLLGVSLFSQIISYLVVASFDNTQTNFFSFFINSNGVLGITLLLAQVIAVFTLLSTRNTAHAKTIILVAGICFGVSLVKSIVSFQIGPGIMTEVAILLVNFLIFRKMFKVYLDL